MNEISIMIDKPKLDKLLNEMPKHLNEMWKHTGRLNFIFLGEPRASIMIPCSEESWRKGYLVFGGITTIKALDKDYLTSEEQQMILKRFCEDVLFSFCENNAIKYLIE